MINLGSLFLKSSGFISLLFEQFVIKNKEIINKIDLKFIILLTSPPLFIYFELKIELDQYFSI